ncbi:MAG TPA: ribosome maturation factor RimP [Marmoricola sp.]|nr:ribosome maturation factor RimP [Marmoricola sp.]
MSTPDTRDRLADLLAGPLASLGVDLEAVELSSAGRRRMLRVAVDKDGGPTMDDIAEATREVSRVLDRSEVMGEQPYTLEVSSRGVDRPLTLPRHWRRNRGRLVKVELAEPGAGEPTVTGRITAADDEAATLDVAGTERRIRYDDVRRARVQIEFKPTPSAEGDRKEG